MQTLAAIKQKLDSAPSVAVRGTLVRLVPLVPLIKHQPLDWLFTSGKPNRYNPAGIECLYFAEREATARAEYEHYWTGLVGEKQPLVTYYAEVYLDQVLDLTSTRTVRAIGIKPADLFVDWRRAKRLTLTQLIGQAVNECSSFSAVRYASKAAKEAGLIGTNIVVFREKLHHPNSVRILGPTKRTLQSWP